MRSTLRLLSLAAALAAASPLYSQASRRDTTDHWQWLEDMNGEKAMTWVIGVIWVVVMVPGAFFMLKRTAEMLFGGN